MKHNQVSRLGGYGIILLSAVFFGTYGVWSRLMGDTFAPFYQAWVRGLIILAAMAPFMLKSHSFRKIDRRDWPAFLLYIAFCVGTQVPLYYAFNHAPIGTVQLIFYSMFVVTAYAVGRVYLGEQITAVKLASIGLAFVGLCIVFGASALSFAPLGLALAALNGIASGGEVSSSKRLSDTYSPALLVFYGWVATIITHLPLSLLLGEKQIVPALTRAWLWLVVYAVVNALAFWLGLTGFKYVDASIGSIIGLMEVVFGILFGALIFHESLSWTVYVGGLAILAAVMLPDIINIAKGKMISRPVEPPREP